MLIAQRQTQLRDLLARRGMCSLEALSAELGVSQSTIRRDVEQLQREGVVNTTRGGVIWLGDRSASATRPYAFDQRMSYQLQAKRDIAKAALQLIAPGQTLLLDGGTTTFYLAEQMAGQNLQIVTNSLPIAQLFINDESVELILIGGLAYPRYGVLLGPMAEHDLAAIHTNSMFLSVAGAHEGSLYNQNLLLVEAEQRMMARSQQVVLLADSSKFGQQALVRLCGLDEIDVVVSDSGLSAEHRRAVQASGCKLIIADPVP